MEFTPQPLPDHEKAAQQDTNNKQGKMKDFQNQFINSQNKMDKEIVDKLKLTQNIMLEVQDLQNLYLILNERKSRYIQEYETVEVRILKKQKTKCEPQYNAYYYQRTKLLDLINDHDYQIQFQKLFKDNLRSFCVKMQDFSKKVNSNFDRIKKSFNEQMIKLEGEITSFIKKIDLDQKKTNEIKLKTLEIQKNMQQLSEEFQKTVRQLQIVGDHKHEKQEKIEEQQEEVEKVNDLVVVEQEEIEKVDNLILEKIEEQQVEVEKVNDLVVVEQQEIEKVDNLIVEQEEEKEVKVDQRQQSFDIKNARKKFLKDSQVMDGLKKTIDSRNSKITFQNISGGTTYGSTGPLKCDKGFKMKVRVLKSYQKNQNWRNTRCLLVESEIKLKEYQNYRDKLSGMEDSNSAFYGVEYSGHNQINTKVRKAKTSNLTMNDEITIIYDKSKRQVSFVSRTFEYYQENLPQDKEFVVGIGLINREQSIEIQLMEIN